jgi:putative membrane protein
MLVTLLAAGYEMLSLRARGWSQWHGAAFMAGCAVLLLGLALPVRSFGDHMLQHVMVAMLAPLGLVLGAPITLLLRTLTPSRARLLVRALRSVPVRIAAHPAASLVLTSGGLLPLYLTPLYAHTQTDPMLHQLVMIHFVLSGGLFAWVVAGPDPAPHRPSVPVRLVVLGVAIAAHATLSQLLYAGAWAQIPAGVADRQAGATIMYYGGDVAELLLAFALVQSRTTRKGR